MDDRERASEEAWNRLDNLRAQSESGRFRGGGGGGCIANCGGMVALIAVVIAGVVALVLMV